MTPSLRRRLLTLLLATVLLAWGATALFSWLDVQYEIGEMLDEHLTQSADLIEAELEHEIEEIAAAAPRNYRHEGKIAFQVWDRSGVLRLRSISAPDSRLSKQDEGFTDAVVHGKRWRIFSRWDEGRRYLIQVGERYEFRDQMADNVAGHLMHPLFVALPALAVLIWFALGAGLAPLKRLAAEVARRAPDNLAPLNEARTPREARPLLRALNALFARLSASIEQERRFTADAAHELRTPLAALKTQAQVALGTNSSEERDQALTQVVSGVGRATHLIEQLLILARLDPQTGLEQAQLTTLRAVAAECVAGMAQAAAEKNIEIGLTAKDEGMVAGDPTLLAVLLRNLVDNAIRYTPQGGNVEVAIERSDKGVILRVADSGPGVQEGERPRIFGRFYRLLGNDGEGSGLGLSIVKLISDLHRANIRLSEGNDGRGLTVAVEFPAA